MVPCLPSCRGEVISSSNIKKIMASISVYAALRFSQLQAYSLMPLLSFLPLLSLALFPASFSRPIPRVFSRPIPRFFLSPIPRSFYVYDILLHFLSA